ncbi:Uncharacterised protein [Vibrio cholerae]|nr:Uncharacterised protein [Vibrio cholerae]
MDINIAIVKIITLCFQCFSMLFGTNTVRTARTTKNDHKHIFLLHFVCGYYARFKGGNKA